MTRVRAAINVYESIKAWHESKDVMSLQMKEPHLWSIVEDVILLRQDMDRHG